MSENQKKAQFSQTANSGGQKEKISGLIIDTFERVETAFSRLSIVEKQLELGVTFYNEEVPLPDQVKDFDALLHQRFLPLLLTSIQIGLSLEYQMENLLTQVTAIRALITLTSHSKKPTNLDQIVSPLIESSKYEFKAADKYGYLQNILQFVSTALLWANESDPVVFLKKYELEVNDIASSINRCQNPLYLKFASDVETFLKEIINYVTKYFKSGLVWKDNGSDAPSQLAFSIYGSQGIVSFSTPPSRTAARIVESKNNWTCEFQGAESSNRKIEFECKLEKATCHIFSCLKTHVTLKGKPDHVRIESCENVTVSVEDVNVAIDVINSRNIEIICNGVVSNINFSNTNGSLIVVQEKSHEIQILSSASTKIYVQNGQKTHRIPEKSTFSIKAGANQQISFK